MRPGGTLPAIGFLPGGTLPSGLPGAGQFKGIAGGGAITHTIDWLPSSAARGTFLAQLVVIVTAPEGCRITRSPVVSFKVTAAPAFIPPSEPAAVAPAPEVERGPGLPVGVVIGFLAAIATAGAGLAVFLGGRGPLAPTPPSGRPQVAPERPPGGAQAAPAEEEVPTVEGPAAVVQEEEPPTEERPAAQGGA